MSKREKAKYVVTIVLHLLILVSVCKVQWRRAQEVRAHEVFRPVHKLILSWTFYTRIFHDSFSLKGPIRFYAFPHELTGKRVKLFEVEYAPLENAWTSLSLIRPDGTGIVVITGKDRGVRNAVYAAKDEYRTMKLLSLAAPVEKINRLKVSVKGNGECGVRYNGREYTLQGCKIGFGKVILGLGTFPVKIYSMKVTTAGGRVYVDRFGFLAGKSSAWKARTYLFLLLIAWLFTRWQWKRRFFMRESGWSRFLSWRCVLLYITVYEKELTSTVIFLLLLFIEWELVRYVLFSVIVGRRMRRISVRLSNPLLAKRLAVWGAALLLFTVVGEWGFRTIAPAHLKRGGEIATGKQSLICYGATKTFRMGTARGARNRADFTVRFRSPGWAEFRVRQVKDIYKLGSDVIFLSATPDFPTHGDHFLLDNVSLLTNNLKAPFCRTCRAITLKPGRTYKVTLIVGKGRLATYVDGDLAESISISGSDLSRVQVFSPTGNVRMSAPVLTRDAEMPPVHALLRVTRTISFVLLLIAAANLASRAMGRLLTEDDRAIYAPAFLLGIIGAGIAIVRYFVASDRDLTYFGVYAGVMVGFALMMILVRPAGKKGWVITAVLLCMAGIELSRIPFNTAGYNFCADWYAGLRTERAFGWFDPELRIFNSTFMQDTTLRDRPVSIDKGKRVRILFLGGSQTYGQSIDSWGGTMSGQLQRLVEKRWKNVEVMNGGTGGATSFSQLLLFKTALMPYRPDIVILNIGANDSLYWRGDIGHYSRFVKRKWGLCQRIRSWSMNVMLIRRFLSMGFSKSFYLVGHREKYFWQNVGEFARLQKRGGYKLLLVKEVTDDICYRKANRVNPFLPGLEKGRRFPELVRLHITPLSSAHAFCARRGDPLFMDGVHLTPMGNELLAKVILTRITPDIERIEKDKRMR